MIAFAGYWTSSEFIDRYGLIGWVEEPRKRTWDSTKRWSQAWTWSGPSANTKAFLNLLAASDQPTSKSYQVVCASEGPITKVSAAWYSDDFDGVYARDPLITTWSMSKNVGNQSVLYSDKSRHLFSPALNSSVLVRIAIAAQGFKAAIASQQQQLATIGRRPTKALVKLLNDCFTDFVVNNVETGSPYADLTDATLQWQACQLYRMICRGVTTAPFSQYVLTKTQVCFPPAIIDGGLQTGTGVRASYDKVFYAFSTLALRNSEPELNEQFAALLLVGQFPITWWIKQPPDVQQTSDSRWQIVQHWYGVRQFEPYVTPWVRAPGETFSLANQFDPSTWADAPAVGEDVTTTLYGTRPVGAAQWSAGLQAAVFGSNQTYEDL